MIPLPDSAHIATVSISCVKNHTIAVEAPIKESPGQSSSSCVFLWDVVDMDVSAIMCKQMNILHA
eukprot:10597425-Ditylum_brightwellii.AAC.1